MSRWQVALDWDAAKAGGVQFAILRSSYAYWDTNYALNSKKSNRKVLLTKQVSVNGRSTTDYYWGCVDGQLQRNIKECERLGIPYGVYHYAYAEAAGDARADAQFVIDLLGSLLGSHKPSLPIFYDLEDAYLIREVTKATSAKAGKAALAKARQTVKTRLANIATGFCGYLGDRGHEAGTYSSLSWYSDKYEGYLSDSLYQQWALWIAQWNTSLDYSGQAYLWQFTNKKQIEGVVDYKGDVMDLDGDHDLTTHTFSRVAGAVALDTMEAVVAKDGVFAAGRGGTVLVASNDGYWDALSASGLAGLLDAPIVTTSGSSLSAQAARALQRLKPSKVYVMGGSQAVTDGVLTAIPFCMPGKSAYSSGASSRLRARPK